MTSQRSCLTSAAILVHIGSKKAGGAADFVLYHAAIGRAESGVLDAAKEELHEGQLLVLRCKMNDVLA